MYSLILLPLDVLNGFTKLMLPAVHMHTQIYIFMTLSNGSHNCLLLFSNRHRQIVVHNMTCFVVVFLLFCMLELLFNLVYPSETPVKTKMMAPMRKRHQCHSFPVNANFLFFSKWVSTAKLQCYNTVVKVLINSSHQKCASKSILRII